MIYSFNSQLLSAQKLATTPARPSNSVSLSGNGVNTISLSTNDVGIAFNALSGLSNVLINCTVEGSLFRIDRVYDGQQMVLVKNTNNNVKTGTIFQFASGGTGGVALSANYTRFTTPESRRLWTLGYR
jgi:hypothetical protein